MRAAAAGRTDAIAALYRRYEDRVLNLAFRITGSEEDAAEATRQAFLELLERLPAVAEREGLLGAHLFAAARTASYDAMEKRPRADPGDADGAAQPRDGSDLEATAELRESPLLEDWQAEIHAANGGLPARERDVLALLEWGRLSYAEIAQIMEMGHDSVPQLISAARLELRDELRGSELAAEPAASEDCAQALPLMAMRDDAELAHGSDDADWLIEHLSGCHDCRLRLDAMQEARLTYSAWEPVAPPPALFGETMARAVELAGQGDGSAPRWSGETAAAPPPGVTAGRERRGPDVGRAAVTRALAPATGELLRRRRREVLLAGGWGAALLLGVLALLVGGVFGSDEDPGSPPEATLLPPAQTKTPTAAETPAPRKRAKKRNKQPDRPSRPAPVVQRSKAPAAVVVLAPRNRAPTRAAPRRNRRERPRSTPPKATPAPEPEERQPSPPPGGTAPAAPTTPAPQPPPAAECTNPAGQPVPC